MAASSGFAWVTPTLHLGPIPAAVSSAVRVLDVESALQAIRSGQVAVLPAGAWGEAEQVLRALGLPEATIADRMHVARYGEIPGVRSGTGPRWVYHVLSGDPVRDHAAIVAGAGVVKQASPFSRHDVHRLHDVHGKGGFTVRVRDRHAPSSGYSVSVHPDYGGVSDVDHVTTLTPRTLAEHRRAIGRAIGPGDDNVHQGAWHDTETGDVYLDTSHIVADEDEARQLALYHRQLAYYDLGRQQSVYFDPTRDEDFHAGKDEAIAKYNRIREQFGEVTPARYRDYEHEYGPHPYAAERERADQATRTARKAAMQARSRYPL